MKILIDTARRYGMAPSLALLAATLMAPTAALAGSPINERAAADPAGSIEVSNVAGTVRVTGWAPETRHIERLHSRC